MTCLELENLPDGAMMTVASMPLPKMYVWFYRCPGCGEEGVGWIMNPHPDEPVYHHCGAEMAVPDLPILLKEVR